jgi:hypothetical protein
MADSAFDEFVTRQRESALETTSIDWTQRLEEWLGYLEKLYSKIEGFLEQYISSGQIQREYRAVELNEENIGSYSARKMVLRIGRQEVDLVPVGTLLLGSKGRVDISGPSGKAQLLLVDSRAPSPRSLIHVTVTIGARSPVPKTETPKDIQWAWKIVTRPPDRRFVELTQQSFFDLILEVANG